MLPGCRERRRDLSYPGIPAAEPAVDLLEKTDLLLEAGSFQRILVAVELLVRAGRSGGQLAGIAVADSRDCIGGAPQGCLGELIGMGIAGRFASDGTKAESLISVIVGSLEPAIVEQ